MTYYLFRRGRAENLQKRNFPQTPCMYEYFGVRSPFFYLKVESLVESKGEDQTIFRHLPPLFLANKDEGMGKVSDEGLGWDFANPILKGQEGVSGMNPNLLWATQRDTSLTKTFFMQYFHKFFNSSHDIPSNRDCDVFKRSNPWYMDIEIILETAYIYWPEKGSGAFSFP